MSVLAICAGLTSIRFALEGQPYVAIALIAAAAILDGLDGRVARALDAESRMGEEIDSLADAVNFGVAPAVVVYVTMLPGLPAGWVVVHVVRGVNRVAAGQIQRVTRRRQPAVVRQGVLRRRAGTRRRDLRARTAGRQAAVRLGLVDLAVVRLHLDHGLLDAVGQPAPDAQDARRLGAAEPGRAAAGRADHRRRRRVAVPLHPDHGGHRGLPLLHPVLGAQPPLAGRAPRGVGEKPKQRRATRRAIRRAQPSRRRSVARLGLRRPTGRT